MSWDDNNCFYEKRSDYYMRTAINNVTNLNITPNEYIGNYPREITNNRELKTC
jgi:hypothetical protein